MSRVIGRDEASARGLLDAAGVRLHAADPATGDARPELVASVLPEGARHVRGQVDAEASDDVDGGMAAWHVNPVDELHVVLSGRGLMEFVTVDGVVTVLVEQGDVVEVRGAEHRYRPLSTQGWRLRFDGPAEAGLEPTQTGRAGDPWPTI